MSLVEEIKIPETALEAQQWLDSALEHASHAWSAMDKIGLIPKREKVPDCWPPLLQWKLADIGTPAYHLAAMIGYVYAVHQGFMQRGEADELSDLDEDYGQAPEG